MQTINVELASNTYPVYLGQGLLTEQSLWQKHLAPGSTLIVSNDVVAPLYLDALKAGLSGREPLVHIIPDGEPLKTVATWSGIIDQLVGMRARRDANVIALGGGVVGDISGFAAASYMRGIRVLQVPTTLLAQVDSSVGGKTAINHEKGKNLIGAFHQPAAVMIDTATLLSLQAREFNAGMAEVVKYGAIRDSEFFAWLESHVDDINARGQQALEYLIQRSILNKAEIVSIDEKEAGVRALLNFGHSFGHALEAETRYAQFLHGEAVAIGMVTAARLSESLGLCTQGTSERLAALLLRFGLPINIPAQSSRDGLRAALELDKKAVSSGLRLILLTELGRAVVNQDCPPDDLLSVMRQSQELDRANSEE